MAHFPQAFQMLLDLIDAGAEFPDAITATLEKFPTVDQIALTNTYDQTW